MSEPTTRRKFLTLVAGSAVGLAGCSGGSDEGEETEAAAGEMTDGGTYRNGVPADTSVAFTVDGGEVTSPFFQWAAEADGVTIEESGEVTAGAGHYHVLVDEDPVEPGEVIPNEEGYVHYGTGATDGVLELEPGEHTLHLQLGDGQHRALPLTDTIEVMVGEEAAVGFETPTEGATVGGSTVEWSATVDSFTIEESGAVSQNAGHLHVVADTAPVAVGEVVPSDANHVHYGGGQTAGELDLAEQLGDAYEPGEHTLHLQMGGGSHRALGLVDTVTVTTE